MDIKRYTTNLKEFIGSLPKTDVSFLYFVKNTYSDDGSTRFIPRINTCAKEWVVKGFKYPLYIILGDGFCYIYKENAIKYDVHLDKLGNVSGFDPLHPTHDTIKYGGGVVVNDVNLGNHLTIGFSKSHVTKKILLMTHITAYIPNPDNPTESQRDTLGCNVYLEPTLDESCDCIIFGKPRGNRLDMYNDEDPDVVPIIKAIHRYIWDGVARGGKPRIKKQSGPAVHIGPKGGKYKLVNGRRMYIGGNGDFKDPITGGFAPSFAEFIKDVVLNAIASYRPDLIEAIVIDDGSANVMVRYVFKAGMDTSHVFVIERTMVIGAWRAHAKPPTERTVADTQAINTFDAFVHRFRAVLVAA